MHPRCDHEHHYFSPADPHAPKATLANTYSGSLSRPVWTLVLVYELRRKSPSAALAGFRSGVIAVAGTAAQHEAVAASRPQHRRTEREGPKRFGP